MDVTQISSTAPQLQGTSSTKINSDYETFLKMLTTQIQNQDPLKPIDSADYAVQLATFSGVEQAVRTNQLLESMQSQFDVLGMAQLAGWVGQEARSTAPVYMDGAPVTLSLNPAASADRAVLVVRDAQGTIMSREEVPTTSGQYQWLGADVRGDPLARGTYTLSLESYFQDDLIATGPVESYAQILEARGGIGGTKLLLRGGVEVAASAVTALRVP
jgi:flagellar basal-body rod modification protein FlgD